MKDKPLGRKSYGSIGHLPNSRLGPGDHKVTDGQARICTEKKRDKWDEIIVTEKLDGSNVGVARIDNEIVALGRSGYLAQTSKYEQHQLFADWVRKNEPRFMKSLGNGERLCGEWLAMAHGTKYDLKHEPFVVLDLMVDGNRLTYDVLVGRAHIGGFSLPHLVSRGEAISVERVMNILGVYGFHGATEPVEGAVWRVERYRNHRYPVVDFLAKYVRPDKVDGKYFDGDPVWNWRP